MNNIEEFKREVKKVSKISKDKFFTWFDGGKGTNSAFIKGQWDFATYISKYLVSQMTNPETKIILEIGYGGGRILAGASKYFKKAIGVDIHTCKNIVEKELKKRSITNFKLYTGDGKSIPLKDKSVDVVYSFIVLQHVEKIEIFENYLKETYRVLNNNGMAVLYFGRYCRFSLNKTSKILYLIDRILERIILKKGFKEIKAPVNCINLIVSMNYAKKICEKLGFKICKELVSKQMLPKGNIYGLQNGLVLKKL